MATETETSTDPKDIAQANLRGLCNFRTGDRYQHYKGGYYTVVCLSLQEDTLQPLITYKSEAKGTFWTRTLEHFADFLTVDTPGEPVLAQRVPRFRLVRSVSSRLP